MIQLIVLLVLYLSLILIHLLTTKKSLITPQLMFLGGFTVSIAYAIPYVEKMQLDMSENTLLVIGGGGILFSVFSFATRYLLEYPDIFMVSYGTGIQTGAREKSHRILVDGWIIYICLLVEAASVLLTLLFLRKLSPGASLSEAVYYYRKTNLFTENSIVFPTYISLPRLITSALASIMIYLLIHQIIYRYRCHSVAVIMCILIACANTLVTGGRSGLIGFVFFSVVFYYYIYNDKYYWEKRLNFKKILKLFILGIGLLVAFYFSAELMGRGKQRAFQDYLCIYFSAELKNLDMFIRNGVFGTDFAHNQTWAALRIFLSKKMGITAWATKLDLPFQYVGSFSLGNVYTTFYAYLYDGGYAAMVFYVILMAVLSQLLHVWLMRQKSEKYYEGVNVVLIIYANVLYALVFSFFSNKFYELIVDIAFLRSIVIWVVVAWGMRKIKFQSN